MFGVTTHAQKILLVIYVGKSLHSMYTCVSEGQNPSGIYLSKKDMFN